MPRVHWRPMALLAAAVFVVAACGGEDAPADDRDAQTLYNDAFDAPPENVSIINVPEGARRPTVSATYPGDDAVAALDEVQTALESSGWEITTRSGEHIVAVRGEDDLQVEATAGDVIVSVTFIFAAPGEGL